MTATAPAPGSLAWQRLVTARHIDRFWSRVDQSADCWTWSGRIDPGGYGRFDIWDGTKTRTVLAHRFAYFTAHGKIPGDLPLDHLCRNTACVRPEHLDAVPQAINMLRGESPYARKARQTHCKHGHEFTPENTYYHPTRGTRNCRTCQRESNRRVYATRYSKEAKSA